MVSDQALHYLDSALSAVRDGSEWQAILDSLPVPTYVTDAEGLLTFWNRACVDFAGREPTPGQDRWCVTMELYTTTGEPLAHGDCPMAEAVRQRKEVRGKIAVAMRPDGTRRAFQAYPTPLFDSSGTFTGAINVLVDVSDEQAEALSEQAKRCRRLARSTLDSDALEILDKLASGYDATAAALRDPH